MLAQIADLLMARGWDVNQDEDLVTGFVLEFDQVEYQFPLYVMSLEVGNTKLIRFVVVPFVEQSFHGYPTALYITLAQLNHDLPQLKFAIDADGDLELVLDIPEAQWTETMLDDVLEILVDYTTTFFSEINTIVNSSHSVDAESPPK